MSARVGLLAVLLQISPTVVRSQDTLTLADTLPGWALNLGVYQVGVSLGNSSRWNGVRINFSDRAVREVNGVNLTLWRPRQNRFATYRGVSVGLAPHGRELIGLSVGLAGVIAERATRGMTVAGLGAVSNGDMMGVHLAGLGVVSQGGMYGLNVAGLGAVSQGDMVGINIAGLGTVAQGRMFGINVSGLGTVAEGSMRGLNVAGLGVVAIRGVTGIAATLGGIESREFVRGFAVAGYRVKSPRVQGFVVPVAWLRATQLDGGSISVYNQVGEQHGLVIGVVNYARELHGVQLGVINIAGNNRGIARVLPLVNLHLK